MLYAKIKGIPKYTKGNKKVIKMKPFKIYSKPYQYGHEIGYFLGKCLFWGVIIFSMIAGIALLINSIH